MSSNGKGVCWLWIGAIQNTVFNDTELLKILKALKIISLHDKKKNGYFILQRSILIS